MAAEKSLVFNVSALDKNTKALERIALRLDRLAAKLDKVDRKRVNVRVRVDTKRAEADLKRFTRRTAVIGKKIANNLTGPFQLARTRISPLLIAAVAAVIPLMPAMGTLMAGLLVTGFGLGIAILAVVFARNIDKVWKAWDKVNTRMQKGLIEVAEVVAPVLVSIANTVIRVFDRVLPTIKRTFRLIAPGIEAFANAWIFAVEQLGTSFPVIAKGFTAIWKAVGKRLPDAFGRIGDALARISRTMMDNPDLFADVFIEVIDLIPAALDFVNALAKLTNELGGIPQFADGAAKALRGFAKGIRSAIKAGRAIANFWGDFLDGWRGGVRASKDEMGRTKLEPFVPKTGAEKAGAALGSVFKSFDFSHIVNAINKGLANADWGKAGKTAGNALVDAFKIGKDGSDKIGAEFVQSVEDINWGKFSKELDGFVIEFLSAVVKAWGDAQIDVLKEIGAQLIDGFVNGWDSRFSDFLAGMPWWLRGLIDLVKKIFGISSPSTVFFDIGANVVQGFIDGFLNKFPTAVANAKSLASKIRSKFNGARGWLYSPGKSVVDGLIRGIKSRLPNLNKTTSSAVSRFVKIFSRIRNTRSSAAYVVNSVMGRLISKFNQVSKALGGKGIGVPKFAGGGRVFSGAMRPEKGGGTNRNELASGGSVRGPGTGTSDSILARLSDGEFVVKEKQTRKHLPLLKAINEGAPGFASGGLIGGDMDMRAFMNPKGYLKGLQAPILSTYLGKLGSSFFDSIIKRPPRKIAEQSQTKIEKIFKTLGFGAGNIGAAIAFAKSQHGKPYQWGGVGNPSWDCSGFMSGITNVLQGRNPRSRLFTTHSFAGGRGVAGFQRGAKSVFQVGVNPGSHMAGTLYAGRKAFNVESGGSANVRFGSGALGAGDFRYRFGLRRFGVPNKGKRGAEGIFAAQGGLIQLAKGGIVKRPIVANIGEAGPEAVIPLRKPQGAAMMRQAGIGGGGGGNVYVTVEAGPLTTAADTGREVLKVLKALQHKNGGAPLNLKTVG